MTRGTHLGDNRETQPLCTIPGYHFCRIHMLSTGAFKLPNLPCTRVVYKLLVDRATVEKHENPGPTSTRCWWVINVKMGNVFVTSWTELMFYLQLLPWECLLLFPSYAMKSTLRVTRQSYRPNLELFPFKYLGVVATKTCALVLGNTHTEKSQAHQIALALI